MDPVNRILYTQFTKYESAQTEELERAQFADNDARMVTRVSFYIGNDLVEIGGKSIINLCLRPFLDELQKISPPNSSAGSAPFWFREVGHCNFNAMIGAAHDPIYVCEGTSSAVAISIARQIEFVPATLKDNVLVATGSQSVWTGDKDDLVDADITWENLRKAFPSLASMVGDLIEEVSNLRGDTKKFMKEYQSVNQHFQIASVLYRVALSVCIISVIAIGIDSLWGVEKLINR
jgi:hypothetical protein